MTEPQERPPIWRATLARFEKLSRAVCHAWGFEPDKTVIIDDRGELGPMWRSEPIRRAVVAYLAMRKADGEE